MADSFLSSLRIYRTPRLRAVFFMGFSSGLPLPLTFATLSAWLSEAGVSRTAIGLFVLVGFSYNWKFIWSPVFDHLRLPVLGRLGRRRSWALLLQALLAVTIFAMGHNDPAHDLLTTAVFAAVLAFFSASQDVVIDAYRIDLLRPEEQAAGAAATQWGYRFGLLASGAGALVTAEHAGWTAAYSEMAALMMIGMATVLLTPEPALRALPTREGIIRRAVVEPFVDFFERHGAFSPERRTRLQKWAARPPASLRRFFLAGAVFLVYAPVGAIPLLLAAFRRSLAAVEWAWLAKGALRVLWFIVLYKLGDALAGTMANPFYIELGFSKDEIATISKVFGLAATLAGVAAGAVVATRLGFLRALLACGILQMLSNLTYALQAVVGHDPWMLTATIFAENFTGGMGSAAFVAYLSSLCNVQFSATQYALFSSLAAVPTRFLSAPSGWIVDHTDWVTFFLITTAAALPGIVMVIWLLTRRAAPSLACPTTAPLAASPRAAE